VRMEPTGRPAIGADAMVTCMLPSCWRGCEATEASLSIKGCNIEADIA
jgi:hypothetical protein